MIKILKSDFEISYDDTARQVKKIRINSFAINDY